MEHQALANWFNTEVRSDSQKILTALSEAKSHKTHIDLNETVLIGSEYSLFIHYDEVMIRANSLAMTIEEEFLKEEGLHYYDEESIAFCGLDDFIHFLTSYFNFIA